MSTLKTAHLTLARDEPGISPRWSWGTVIYLTGRVFTAREGVYQRAVEDGVGTSRPAVALGRPSSTARRERSSIGRQRHGGRSDGHRLVRFAKWLDGGSAPRCNIIIGKGGMTAEIYRATSFPTTRSISRPSDTAPAHSRAWHPGGHRHALGGGTGSRAGHLGVGVEASG